MNILRQRILPYEVQLNELISVSCEDQFVGAIDKWKAHSNTYLGLKKALPHRAFSIFLFNNNNELLMQKRSKEKKTFPLCWTNTCCSHPNMVKHQDGILGQQPIRQSLHRALYRQFKIDLGDSPFYFMSKILYKQQGFGGANDFGEYQVDYVYLNKVNKDVIRYEDVPSEVGETKWIQKSQASSFVNEITKSGGYFSPWFLKMHSSGLLNQWWDMIQTNNIQNRPGQNIKKTLKL